ncbi:hypothetical protein T12_14002, partial [Trichinella patagoniensis]
LSAKHSHGRCYTNALVDATVVLQHDEGEHFIPLLLILLAHNGQHVQECAIESFSLSIPLRMVRGGPRLFDVEKAAQQEHRMLPGSLLSTSTPRLLPVADVREQHYLRSRCRTSGSMKLIPEAASTLTRKMALATPLPLVFCWGR